MGAVYAAESGKGRWLAMAAGAVRKIITIDEEKCDGCGSCVPACAEGAIGIIGGKAKVVSEARCDGLGACIGECPRGAITIEEREAEPFEGEPHHGHVQKADRVLDTLPCGCPSSTVEQFALLASPGREEGVFEGELVSELGHWPVQLPLIPATAPFLKDADVLLAADCVPFAYADFHRDFVRDRAVLVACPKLDDYQSRQRKLTEIVRQSGLRSITVVRMEVPCCSGLLHMAKEAIAASGRDIPSREIVVGTRGEVKSGCAVG